MDIDKDFVFTFSVKSKKRNTFEITDDYSSQFSLQKVWKVEEKEGFSSFAFLKKRIFQEETSVLLNKQREERVVFLKNLLKNEKSKYSNEVGLIENGVKIDDCCSN